MTLCDYIDINFAILIAFDLDPIGFYVNVRIFLLSLLLIELRHGIHEWGRRFIIVYVTYCDYSQFFLLLLSTALVYFLFLLVSFSNDWQCRPSLILIHRNYILRYHWDLVAWQHLHFIHFGFYGIVLKGGFSFLVLRYLVIILETWHIVLDFPTNVTVALVLGIVVRSSKLSHHLLVHVLHIELNDWAVHNHILVILSTRHKLSLILIGHWSRIVPIEALRLVWVITP